MDNVKEAGKLRASFNKGEVVWLDKDLSTKNKVIVIGQSPSKLCTSVSVDWSYVWEVMTYRLTKI